MLTTRTAQLLLPGLQTITGKILKGNPGAKGTQTMFENDTYKNAYVFKLRRGATQWSASIGVEAVHDSNFDLVAACVRKEVQYFSALVRPTGQFRRAFRTKQRNIRARKR